MEFSNPNHSYPLYYSPPTFFFFYPYRPHYIFIAQTPCETINVTYCFSPYCCPKNPPPPSSVTISELKDPNQEDEVPPAEKPTMHAQKEVTRYQEVKKKEKKKFYYKKAFFNLRKAKNPFCETRFEAKMEGGEAGSELNTTVMIKNIPSHFSKKMVLGLLDGHCMEVNEKLKAEADDQTPSEFDFLYLPIDFSTGNNYGYAFVNFTSAAAAWRLHGKLHQKAWGRYGSKKVCEVNYARIQGLNALVRHFSGSVFVCKSDEYMPVCFEPGRDGARKSEEKIVGKRYPSNRGFY